MNDVIAQHRFRAVIEHHTAAGAKAIRRWTSFIVATLFLRKQKRFLFISDGSVQTEAISNSLFGAN
jgi:hypothetical protein